MCKSSGNSLCIAGAFCFLFLFPPFRPAFYRQCDGDAYRKKGRERTRPENEAGRGHDRRPCPAEYRRKQVPDPHRRVDHRYHAEQQQKCFYILALAPHPAAEIYNFVFDFIEHFYSRYPTASRFADYIIGMPRCGIQHKCVNFLPPECFYIYSILHKSAAF